jgi:glutathione synthase
MTSATRPARLLSLLVPAFPVINPNLDVLRPALLRAGIAFEERAFDHVRLRGCDVEAPDANGDYAPLRDAALLWPLGFGTRTNFLDKLQLLELACRDTRCVTAPDALVLAHAKYDLVRTLPPLRHPETYASHDARWLWGIVQSGGEWIAKPPAASFGRGVFRLDANDRNGLAVLEQLTEHGRGTLALLQRYVPEIAQGEKRVLLAFGAVIGAYARLPNAAGITNLAAGARAVATSLDAAESAACTALAQQLQSRGIGFAGIDLVYPWLIEVNIANPGGLATLVELGDVGAPDRLAAAVKRALHQG